MNERQLKLMRVICPFINSNIRPHLMTFISFMELKISIASIKKPLEYLFTSSEPIVTDKEQLINTLKCNVNKDEAQIIENFLMMEQMMNIMEMMKDMQPFDTTCDSQTGTGHTSQNPESTTHEFELLKNFLPKESVETFELVKMMMENNNES